MKVGIFMKKIYILSVSILLCIISVFPTNAYYPPAYYKTAKINGVDFKYRVIENKSVEIIKGEGFIPDEIEGYPVTIIGERAYELDEDNPEYSFVLNKNWEIPDTVTYIDNLAFRFNTSVEKITIPSSVTYIGSWAFYKCTELKSVKIPSSIYTIPMCAFSGCTKLKKVELANTVREIDDCAFFNCSKLKSINMPNLIDSIGEAAFYNCTSLKKLDFSDAELIQAPLIGKNAIGFYDSKTKYSNYYIPKKIKNQKKVSDFKIICEPSVNDFVIKYAFKNKFNLTFDVKNKYKFFGECNVGDTVKIIVDGKSLNDFKAKNTKIINITKNGKVTGLKNGKTNITVTLPNGKKLTGLFRVKR